MDVKGKLSSLAGGPAWALLVIGLVLVLLAPALVWNRQASYRGLRVQLDNLSELKDLELGKIRKDQEKERKTEEDAEKALKEKEDRTLQDLQAAAFTATPEQAAAVGKQRDQITQAQRKRADEARAREDKRTKDLEAKTEEIAKKYDEETLKRQLLDEQIALAGARSDIWLGFFGRLFMILSLLLMTLESEGLRQKVLLAVLVLVLLTLLPGPGLSLRANLGAPDTGAEYSRPSK
ncbi:MAG: hypothetical protein KA419_08490 [Acidobacteria bacterium]|nr:hypothetical protein [Acidobacteriota bacterium]